MIASAALLSPPAKRFRICRERKTRAGIATESVGLFIWAVDAEAAVANAKKFGMYDGMTLVAIPEAA